MSEISVIVPVYKVEKYLKRCVDSILNQSFSDYDLILVDDGSPDNCPQICDDYARLDSRVHVIHQVNGGLSAARNAGLDYSFINSNSRWIAFIDSDDCVHRDYLSVLMKPLIEGSVKVSVCSFCHTTNDFQVSTVYKNLKTEKAWVHYYNECITAWGKIISKDLYNDVRFPEGRYCEDAATIYIPLFSQESIAINLSKLYLYFINPAGIMQSKCAKVKEDQVTAFKEELLFFNKNGFHKAAVHPLLWISVVEMREKRDTGLTKEYHKDRTLLRLKLLRAYLSGSYPIRKNYYTYRAAWPRFFDFLHSVKRKIRGKQ